jgi:hypothetical protein
MPIAPRAEDAAQPLPLDKECHVPPDELWSDQEKFVWDRVCVGDIADFNRATGKNLDPRKPEGWPENRILRSSFIETILLKDTYRHALTRNGVRITGARFAETLDLSNADLAHVVQFSGCLFEVGVSFNRAKTTHLIMISDSKIAGPLDMSELESAGSVYVRDGSQLAAVTLTLAHVAGDLDLTKSRVDGNMSMDRLQVGVTVFMQGMEVKGNVNLGSAHVGDTVIMQGIEVNGDVSLGAAHIAKTLDLVGAQVTGAVNLNSIQVDAAVFMRGGAKFKTVDLRAARIGTNLDFQASKVIGELNMNALQLSGSLLMRDNAQFTSVDLRRARIGGSLELERSRVTDMLDMKGTTIGAVLFMQEAMFADVHLEGSHVAGDVELNGSYVKGTLYMNSINVGGGLHMRGASASGDPIFHDVSLATSRLGVLDLAHARVRGKLDMVGVYVETYLSLRQAEINAVRLSAGRVGGNLSLTETKIGGQLDMNGLRIEGTLSGHRLYVGTGAATSARIGGQFDLTDATVDGDLVGTDLETGRDLILTGGKFHGLMRLNRARVTGNLELNKGEFHKLVNLTGAHIGGAANFAEATWPDKGAVRLRDAHADIISGFANAGPKMEKSRDAKCPTTQARSPDELTGTSRLDLDGFTYRSVNNPTEFGEWFNRFDCYSAQPYSQLAAIVQAQGNYELAIQIRFAGRDRERHESSGLAYAWLTMLWATIGYGYYPQLALIWVFVFVAVGTITLGNSEQSCRNGLSSWADNIVFSIDTLLPIIRLREQNYKIDLKGALAYYFYFHKIMGYVLASFLIAGLSGLTK